MAACDEISNEDVALLRRPEALAVGTPAVAERPSVLESESAVGEPPSVPAVAGSPIGARSCGEPP